MTRPPPRPPTNPHGAPDTASGDHSRRTEIFIDAIEDGLARALSGEDAAAFELPIDWLPAGTREGDWLTLTVTRSAPPRPDDPSQKTPEERRADLSADDPGGPIKL